MAQGQRITLSVETIKRLGKYREGFDSPDETINKLITKMETLLGELKVVKEIRQIGKKANKPKRKKGK